MSECRRFFDSLEAASSLVANIGCNLNKLHECKSSESEECKSLFMAIQDDLITFEDVYNYLTKGVEPSKGGLYWLDEDDN